MRILLIAAIGVLTFCSYAQKASTCSFSAFGKEYNKFLEAQPDKNYSVVITSTYFKDVADKEPFEKTISSLKVFENSDYIYNGGSTVQIQEGDLRLDIDTIKKRTLVSKANKIQDLVSQYPSFADLDSSRYKITKTETKQKVTYEVTEIKRSSQYRSVKMSFDLTTKRFLELEMQLWPQNYSQNDLDDNSLEAPRIILTYTNFTLGLTEKNKSTEEELTTWMVNNSGTLKSAKDTYLLYDLRKQ
jgi:hypothetical protein